MMRNAATATAVLALLLAGAVSTHARARDYGIESLDVLRLLAQKPWIASHNRWDRGRPIDDELENNVLDNEPKFSNDVVEHYVDDDLRKGSEKRSAVATALNSGRRRRQPAPALGVLNDVTTFFDSLRDNIETLASLSPQERSTLFHEPPNVVQVPNNEGRSGGGYGKLHAFRPLRPPNSRSYNRRSPLEAEVEYPGANHHDPELLWTGLGR